MAGDQPDYGHLTQALANYMAIEVVTMYENNISQHYFEYVALFVDTFQRKKAKEYRNSVLAKKQTTVDGLTVQQLESGLSGFSRKTVDFEGFKEYLRRKNQLNDQLKGFYQQT